MKSRFILLVSLLFATVSLVKADIPGDWKVYPTFDNQISKVIDAPDKVFMLANGQAFREGDNFPEYNTLFAFLFVYDKDSEEFLSYSKRNYLSENLISCISYNPDKKYLLIVYNNSNIDILDEDGVIHNIPGLMTASLTQSKNVNSITFDSKNDLAYLATNFGYVAINDKKYEISESRIYNTKLTSAGRIGDQFIVFDAEKAYSIPYSSPRLALADYTELKGFEQPTNIMPMSSGDTFLMLATSTQNLHKVTLNGTDTPEIETITSGRVLSHQPAKRGYYVNILGSHYLFPYDGSEREWQSMGSGNSAYNNAIVGSWDFKDFWFAFSREGLCSLSYNKDSNSWTVTRDKMLPNAPNVMRSQYMRHHPRYGMLVNNRGLNLVYPVNEGIQAVTLCGLKNGNWTPLSPAYRNTDRLNGSFVYEPAGVAIDPDNDKYVYMGSRKNGLLRLNLDDASDILHMSKDTDPDKGNPGFHEIIKEDPSASWMCQFVEPSFDNNGNLWTGYLDYMSRIPSGCGGRVWVWPSDKRKAGDPSGWFAFDLKNVSGFTKGMQIIPLRHANNKNLVLIVKGSWDGPIYILDHKGTVTDTSDDEFVTMGTIYDQDGSSVTKHYCYKFYEDPKTGNVWVGTFNGVFYFSPKSAMSNPQTVTRVKVARGDGTNLADYLLDNVAVYDITSDASGRIWFGTNGGGILCTSNDGREVLGQFIVDNSYITGNVVTGLQYNPDTNSMMVSSTNGMCEFFMAGSSTGSDMNAARAYPNPVRPDYLGWVTIDGLTDNALVKIVDSAGNLVTELGRAEGGSIKWDVCNAEGNRVKTGVYFVAMSSGNDNANMAKVTKILVVN